MRTTYRALAYAICALVALQAASHAWASSGLVKYLSEGGVIDFTSDSPPPVPEFLGLMIHGMNGMYVIPLVALVLLAVAFASRIQGAVAGAAVVVVLVAVQVTLGFLGHGISALAFLHGVNALLLFAAALLAGRLAGTPRTAPTPTARSEAAGVR